MHIQHLHFQQLGSFGGQSTILVCKPSMKALLHPCGDFFCICILEHFYKSEIVSCIIIAPW